MLEDPLRIIVRRREEMSECRVVNVQKYRRTIPRLADQLIHVEISREVDVATEVNASLVVPLNGADRVRWIPHTIEDHFDMLNVAIDGHGALIGLRLDDELIERDDIQRTLKLFQLVEVIEQLNAPYSIAVVRIQRR